MKKVKDILVFKDHFLLFVTIFLSTSFLGYIDSSNSIHQRITQTELTHSNNHYFNKKTAFYNGLMQPAGKEHPLFNYYEYIKSALLTFNKLTKIKYDNFSIKEYFPHVTRRFITIKQLLHISLKDIFTTKIG
jgi:hypothetical protein